MSDTQEITLTAAGELNVLDNVPVLVAGKWHNPDKPVQNAAYRMAYMLLVQRYSPHAVYTGLLAVFYDTGLLSADECEKTVNVAFGFAGMPVMGRS